MQLKPTFIFSNPDNPAQTLMRNVNEPSLAGFSGLNRLVFWVTQVQLS